LLLVLAADTGFVFEGESTPERDDAGSDGN
jgi:hypothetical protein